MLDERSVFFIDGVSSAYLSSAVKAPKILFLHADHRSPDGTVNPRARTLIEAFDGNAIATTTNRHKDTLLRDLSPTSPIHVVPHLYTAKGGGSATRENIVTVSRLDVSGKPIDECIRAFDMVRHKFPDVEYHIYGDGKDAPILQGVIDELGCAA
ncbi:glycosyltransferase family protein [Paracoccus thiocyanatus]|uniref:hypothetical protein n=1 Tax=Paracoccus thiocyanatus TaxID=34006 RepID=UPI00122C9657|nr:hypothetical protein [Paracoccus thiocyanatus]